MSRLNKLYEALETLRKEGVSTDEMEAKIREAEEGIIKNEILPIVTKNIAPALSQVQRELVLVVDYKPGADISVHLSRKRNLTEGFEDTKEIKLDDPVEHSVHKGMTNICRSSSTAMSVTFPDGTIIAEAKATDTFVKTIKKIGVLRVRQVVESENIILCKVPLISNRRDAKYGTSQKDLGDGWLLITHSSNQKKKELLKKISDALHLGLKIEIKK